MKTLRLSVFFLFTASFFARAENIRICFTSDVQGSYMPSEATWLSQSFPPPLGGAASLATLCSVEKPDLLFDAGNFWGLSPAGKTDNDAGIYVLKNIRYDAMSVGIDDLFNGVEFLLDLSRKSGVNFISSSISDTLGSFPFEPCRIFEINKTRIGVFGIISSHADWFIPQSALNGYVISKEIYAADKQVRHLIEQDCNLVIALSHSGFRHDTLLANSVEGIDIIIGGFDGFAGTWESSINHTISFRIHGNLSSVGMIDIDVSPAGNITRWNFREVNLFTEAYNPDGEIIDSLRSFWKFR